jgi:hypothetical protein
MLPEHFKALIVGTNRTYRGHSIDVVGKKLSEVLTILKRQVVDIESILFMFAKNSRKIKEIIEFFNGLDGSNRKIYIIIRNYIVCS